MPGAGIEPAHHYWREILSLLCLPISPSGLRLAIIPAPELKKGKVPGHLPFFVCGAGEESRTLDLYLGKVSLYQLSYSRVKLLLEARAGVEPTYTDLQSGA